MSSLNEVWHQAILPISATIQEAIRKLDQVGIRIVLILKESGELYGTLSDGDIRRGLLKGLGLDSAVASVVHRDPLVVPRGMGRETVLQIMVANKIHQIPIVDDGRHVIGLHLWDELTVPAIRKNTMVIMAGGAGTRLRPQTDTCPKPLLPVHGKPILEHIIERAKADGFAHFVLAVHYLGHKIEEYFGNGERWKVKIQYLREPSPLGTVGALALFDPRPEEPFVITNGDVLTDIRYGELLDFHIRHAAAATMAVRLHEWRHPFGVVQTEGVEITGFEEKPILRTHINAGVYALAPDTIDLLKPGEQCDMPALFERLQARSRRTIAYPMHEPWLDVGRPEDLLVAGMGSEGNRHAG